MRKSVVVRLVILAILIVVFMLLRYRAMNGLSDSIIKRNKERFTGNM